MDSSTSVQMLVTQGRFRDNRRGQLTIERDAEDLARIIIRQSPADPRDQNGGTTTELVLADGNLAGFIAQLVAIQSQERRQSLHVVSA